MRKRYWLPLGLLGLVVYFTLQWQDTSKSTEENISKASVSSYAPEAQMEKDVAHSENTPEGPKGLITESEVKELRRSFPHTQDVKAEVAENPHQTPSSLIKFAETLGHLVEKGLKNPGDANLLINTLEDCVLDENVIVSSRALCLSRAEQLAIAYPQFKSNFSDMRKNAGAEVLELERRKKSFIKKH